MRSGVSTTLAIVPGHGLKAFARRQVGRLVGAVLVAGAVLALAALATWNVADPSFSHATDNVVTNAIGYPGAILADLAMQFYGLAAVALLVPVVVWGILLLTARGITRLPRRAIAWLLASMLAAAVAGCFTAPPTWPLPTGLGGVFGDMALKLPALFTGAYPEGWVAKAMALGFAAPAVLLYVYGAGLISRPNGFARLPEEEGEDEPFVDADDDDHGEGMLALGAITHWWLTLRAFVRRKTARMRPVASDDDMLPAESGWRRAAVRVEMAERAEARVNPQSRARVEPEFFAALVADNRGQAVRREPTMEALAAEAAVETFDDYSDYENAGDDLGDDQGDAPGNACRDVAYDAFDEPFPFDRAQDMSLADAASGRPVPAAVAVRREPELSSDPASAPNANTRVQAFRSPAGEAAKLRVEAPAPRPAPAAPQPARGSTTERGTRQAEVETFEMPALGFLAEPKSLARDATLSKDALEQNARILEGVLDDFGVKGEIINVRPGPVVTLYELEPAPGIKSSRVIGLADDIARSMSAIACRVAVVPGRNAIGIELPNAKRETVYLRELLASKEYVESKASLALALGKTINGEAVIADIAKMPHVLVAGTTGSGKSVAINTMILSLLYRLKPEQCRLIMVDPKMVELSVYDGIPHLLTPVVTDPKKAVVALKWTVREMEDRYRKMAKLGVRNAEGFNARVAQAAAKGDRISRTVQTGFDRETGEAIYETEELDLKPMPFIVVIIDEVADLMMVAGKDIEGAVQRLGQMARAAGIHVVMATQRPSVDVITGTIKANFPTRMSFQVTSKIDSRTILGEQGAEQLLGMGDMLFMAGGGRIQRVHGPFVSDNEVEKVVAHLKLQGVPEYLDAIVQDDEDGDDDAPAGRGGGAGSGGGDSFDDSDDPYDQAVAVVLRDGKASTSYIQRRLGIGYNRAASIIERMEKEGIVGAANHAGKREILVPTEEDKM